MKKGEIWRVRIPFRPGHTQTGDRPAVIVQDDQFNVLLPTILIIPFTSTRAASRFSGTYMVQPTPGNGLSLPSIALIFQMIALDKRDCIQRLGIIDTVDLDRLYQLLDQLTGR
ncbi:MAG TPA: type II toxin-antitoxin system PemK/MazF family toxin [Gemmataceae bacterium]|jgi:mRNA interferase MazF|nr:type II toxin-antitoxin system PemK/MazF family toxin [Gemmataceae bacterium]